MRSSTLKPRMHFPRCLVCSQVLWLRSVSMKPKKTITCTKCGVLYSRTMIVDADPEAWNRARARELYEIKRDHNGRRLLFHKGMGSRRIADPNEVDG